MSLTGKITLTTDLTDIFSGDNINLIIEIENREELFIKEIFLQFFGEMKCEWDDLVSKNIDGEIVYVMQVFKDSEVFVNKHLTLLNMNVLNEGKYSYNVVLNIPQGLPESVAWRYGSVGYELALGICGTKGKNILFKMPLNVKRYLNICLANEYMLPFHTVFTKSFCWGTCYTQPMKIIITLPKTCFLPGDSLRYFIKIEKFSRWLDLQHISILLTQTQHYKVRKPVKRVKQVHTTLKQIKHNFAENQHNSKVHGSFLLPKSLLPSAPTGCFLNTSYNLHFILVFTGLQTDGFVLAPLKIGSHRNNLEKIADFTRDETISEMGGGDNNSSGYEV